MSNAMIANAWLQSGDGPGSKLRPGFGRYSARDRLICHQNLNGEVVFLAARRWQYSRAQSQAAKMRLDRALRTPAGLESKPSCRALA